MLPTFIAIIAIAAVAVLWMISTHRRLAVHDEHIGSAMSQIGVQLSGRMDALMALLELTKNCAEQESEIWIAAIQSRRSTITAKSTPNDVLRQEAVIATSLGWIAMVTERCPELKANQAYKKTMDSVQAFENMVRISRLIYNDSVMKLNREIRMFPVSMIAGMLGFRQRDYLEEQETRAEAILQAVREMVRGNGQQKPEQSNQSIKMEELRT
ncbi:MAG: hypothetical protein K0R57_2486 [Paenibacillaceae bacterium]|jgi:LemA protein|nr:hypothetical protein [Paenibacillaceae bacterium]